MKSADCCVGQWGWSWWQPWFTKSNRVLLTWDECSVDFIGCFTHPTKLIELEIVVNRQLTRLGNQVA